MTPSAHTTDDALCQYERDHEYDAWALVQLADRLAALDDEAFAECEHEAWAAAMTLIERVEKLHAKEAA